MRRSWVTVILATIIAPASSALEPDNLPLTQINAPAGAAVSFSQDGRWFLLAGGEEAAAWDAQGFQRVIKPVRHDGELIRTAQFSPDGSRILTAAGKEACVWSAATGERLFTLSHDEQVQSARFSPDGRRIATAGDDGAARLWDAADGKQLLSLPNGRHVRSAEFSPRGDYLVTIRIDPAMQEWVPWRGIAQLWDLENGKEIPLGDQRDPCAANIPGKRSTRPVAFSPDRRTVAIVFSSIVTIHDLWTGRLLDLIDIAEVDGTSASVDYSPDGQRLVLVTEKGNVEVWDVAGKHLVCPKFGGHARSARFSADGERLAIAGVKGQTGVWSAVTGEQSLSISDDDAGPSPLVALSPDGSMLLVSDRKKAKTTAWRVPPRTHEAKPVVADAADLWKPAGKLSGAAGVSVSFSKDGGTILTAGQDAARAWNVRTLQPLSPPLKHEGEIVEALLSGDGSKALTAGGRTVRVWEVSTGKQLFSIDHTDIVRSAAFSRDGRLVATAAKGDGNVRVRKAGTGEPIFVLAHPDAAAYFVAFSPADDKILTLARGRMKNSGAGAAVLWDGRTGRELRRKTIDDWIHGDGDDWARSAAFSPDGRKVATIFFRDVDVWNADTGEKLVSMDTVDAGGGTSSMVFSPDSERIMTLDGVANYWETARQNLLIKVGGFSVADLVFDPGGKQALVAGDREDTGLWDLATGRRTLRIPSDHVEDVPAIAFSPNGSCFAVSDGKDGETTIWLAQPPPAK